MSADNSGAGGYVVTERTDEATVTTTVVTPEGVTSHPCPGGFTADEICE